MLNKKTGKYFFQTDKERAAQLLAKEEWWTVQNARQCLDDFHDSGFYSRVDDAENAIHKKLMQVPPKFDPLKLKRAKVEYY